MLNNVTLIGNISTEPEIRRTPNGRKLVEFNIAVNRSFKKQENNTDFIKVQAWGKIADYIANNYEKGFTISIRGTIRTNRFTDKNGSKRNDMYVLIQETSIVKYPKDYRKKELEKDKSDDLKVDIDLENGKEEKAFDHFDIDKDDIER